MSLPPKATAFASALFLLATFSPVTAQPAPPPAAPAAPTAAQPSPPAADEPAAATDSSSDS